MSARTKIKNVFLQLFPLALVVALIWFWTTSLTLAQYNLHLVALLVTFYSLAHLLVKKKSRDGLLGDILFLIAILLLALSSTGGLGSPFFFLLYFLLFAAAMLFSPLFTLFLALFLLFFFLGEMTTVREVLQLLSLLFLTPLAVFFGQQYLKLLQAQEKIKILHLQGKRLKETVEKEETESLLWLSLELKNGLLNIIHQATELLADNRLPLGKTGRDSLQSIHQTAKSLLESGKKLQEKIDKETD